jgi:hypothetical protein
MPAHRLFVDPAEGCDLPGIRNAAEKVKSNERGRPISRSSRRVTRRAAQSQQPDAGRYSPGAGGQRDQLGSTGELRMLRPPNACRTERPGADDPVSPLQPAKHRLKAPSRAKAPARVKDRSKTRIAGRSSLEANRELLSASTSTLLSDTASSAKGQTTSMREFVQIDSPSEHACGQPSIERLHVLEPVSMRWSWVRVFGCCNQVAFEPIEEEHEHEQSKIKRAA